MIAFTELVFDQIVRGDDVEVFSSSKYDELLGSAYDLTLEVEVEETTGSPDTITVKLHHSNSGKGFKALATVISTDNGITQLPYRTVVNQSGPFGKLMRVGVTLLVSSGTPTAHVRVWATGRTRG